MATIRLILASVLLIIAAYTAAMNWGCVIVSSRNKKRGIDRHHSTVPLVSFLIAVLAGAFYPWAWRIVVAIPLLDIGNWVLFLAPFALIGMLLRRKTPGPAASPNAEKLAKTPENNPLDAQLNSGNNGTSGS
jgi:hypothetical protein